MTAAFPARALHSDGLHFKARGQVLDLRNGVVDHTGEGERRQAVSHGEGTGWQGALRKGTVKAQEGYGEDESFHAAVV
jgi:hypothetical protein